jgi:hypothetical protein
MARRRPQRGEGVSRGAWGAIHPLLDLHGQTGDEARRLAHAFLRERRLDGERTVVLVTGKGMHSAGMRPVLLGEVEDLLRGLRGTVVAGFSRLHGGGGFRVELTRRPPEPEPRGRPHAALDRAGPELLRRAEEALWELGIQPTPALLDAEVRRLLREGGGGEP